MFRPGRLLVGGAALVMVGGAAYKIGQSSAQKIEQATGKKPEEMTPEELEATMEQLGIDQEELTEQDMAAIDQYQAAAPPAAAPPAAPAAPAQPAAPPAAAQPSYLDELKKLAELRDAGIVTEEEFEAKKKQLLGL